MEQHRPLLCGNKKGGVVCNLYKGHYPDSPHHEIGTGFYWHEKEPVDTSEDLIES